MYFRKSEFVQAKAGLRKQIETLELELSTIGATKVVCRKKGDKFYYTEANEEGEKGITNDRQRIEKITWAEFGKRQLKFLKTNERVMEFCVKNYVEDINKSALEELKVGHPNLPAEKILFSNNVKGTETKGDVYEKNPYYQENLKYVTTNGVVVRSKSEREIGNALEEVGVEYESDVLMLCGDNRYYADFVIKRPNGTKLVWEHFGREHDSIYMAKNAVRIKDYMKLGMRPWEDLVWTLDSDIDDSRKIRRIIHRFILSELDCK